MQDDTKITENEKDELVSEANKEGEAVAKSIAKEKANDAISAIEGAISSIAKDATFEQTDDKLVVEIPLVDEAQKQELIDKLVKEKLAAAEAEAEKLAQAKVEEELRKRQEAAKAEEMKKAEEAKKVEEIKVEKPVEKPVEKQPVKKEPVVKAAKPKVVPSSKPVQKKKPEPITSTGNLKVTLVKSLIGTLPNQRRTAKALGLSKKISSYSIRPNNAVTKGMIDVVRHLVRVEEV